MVEELLDLHGIFNAGDDPDVPAAFSTRFDIDMEDALQALRPAHGKRAVRRMFWFIRPLGLGVLAPLRGCHHGTVLAVGGKHAVEAGQVDARPGHQGRQLGDELQRLKDDVGGPVPVGRAPESVARVRDGFFLILAIIRL